VSPFRQKATVIGVFVFPGRRARASIAWRRKCRLAARRRHRDAQSVPTSRSRVLPNVRGPGPEVGALPHRDGRLALETRRRPDSRDHARPPERRPSVPVGLVPACSCRRLLGGMMGSVVERILFCLPFRAHEPAVADGLGLFVRWSSAAACRCSHDPMWAGELRSARPLIKRAWSPSAARRAVRGRWRQEQTGATRKMARGSGRRPGPQRARPLPPRDCRRPARLTSRLAPRHEISRQRERSWCRRSGAWKTCPRGVSSFEAKTVASSSTRKVGRQCDV
jgi:hypothetical protein